MDHDHVDLALTQQIERFPGSCLDPAHLGIGFAAIRLGQHPEQTQFPRASSSQ
jgi:hypothetical protein